MSLATTTLYQIVIMFIMILIGIICYKTKVISGEANKTLSNIVLMLINPMVIFTSYQIDFDMKLFKGLLISIVLAILGFAITIVISYILIRKTNKSDFTIERFCCIYSNCGFIGIPLVNGMFGKEGVFYLTAYVTIFNIILWTQGVIMMTGEKNFKELSKALISPAIISIVLGLLFFILRIHLPNPILDAFNYIASMNTPFAMLVAGVSIAQTNILKSLKKLRTYWICIIKLLIVPIILLLLLTPFNISKTILLTFILATACPTGASATLFALKYNKDSIYASELFALTTIFSIVTIPLVVTVAESIL